MRDDQLREPGPGPSEGSAPNPVKETILIADDVMPNLHLLSLMLTERGYKVRTVRDGARALEAVQANPPDLILLDVMMPEMSGYEVCERLKADEQARDIPIIFLSALGAAEDKVKAFTAGGVDYITKPFRVEEVLARVETHLALRNMQKHLAERNARLEQEVAERKRTEVAERSARELAEVRAAGLNILRNVAETLNQAASLQEAIQFGLEAVLTLLGAQAGWITFEDEHGVIRLETTRDLLPTFRSIYDAGLPCSSCRRLSRLLAGDLTGPVLNTECGVLESIPRDTRWFSDGVIVVPLHLGKRVLGALHLVTHSQVAPTGDERRLLTIIGDQYSAAIERARLFDDVQRLAITDSLTGLFTRRHFWTLAQQEFERADRYEHPLSVVMLDVDHFKQINDGYGHVVGDRALRVLAKQCRGSLRKVDILARYGGDEFVILLPETDSAKAQQIAERLRQQIAETPVDTDGSRLSITVSLGVASLERRKETPTPEELVDRADEALYAAKQGGRNRVMAWIGDAKDRSV